MAGHPAPGTASRGATADLRIRRALAGGACAAGLAALAGCGGPGASACDPPSDPPLTLSGDDRRAPVVASDGGALAVAAWERLSGGPAEAALRGPDGRWGPAAALSGDGPRELAVAAGPAGQVAVAWARPVDRRTTVIEFVEHTSGRWSAPRAISTAGRAREPQLAITGDGTIIAVWRRQTHGGDTVVETAERPPGAAWGLPNALSDGRERARRPRLAAAPSGAAIAAWEVVDGRRLDVVAVSRAPAGTWTSPRRLTGGDLAGQEPDVAISPDGVAAVAWVGELGDGAAAVAAVRDPDAGWSEPRIVTTGDDLPYEISRPGRAETGADVAAIPGGAFAAVWPVVSDGTNAVMVSRREAGGEWASPKRVSAAGAVAGGAQITFGGAGVPLVAWEEVDGGLLRGRWAALDAAGEAASCADLSSAVSETAGIRLAGGAAPIAVFVDLNRSRVQAEELR